MIIKIPRKKENKPIILTILEFFRPEYLNISIWLSLKRFMKKTCVDIKNINGNISKIKDGEFKIEI
tara:strand:+ start:237 stop:434 length:198 start_codon:yes stop_codon:yes gene_type:complete